MWVVEICDPSGNRLAELSNATSVRFSLRLNQINRATFELDANDPAVTSDILHVGRNEVKIRNGQTYFFGGKLVNVRVSNDERGNRISVTAYSYEWLLSKRVFEAADASVTTGYSATDIGAIIGAVITETQAKTNGTFGMSAGTIQTSVNRTREDIKVNDEVWHFIQLFTKDKKSESVDFEITPAKVWNVYYPRKGYTRPTIELTYPGIIQSFVYERDAQDMANEVLVRGDGTDDMAIQRGVEDTTQQTTYALLQKPTSYGSDDNTVLDNHGNGILELISSPLVVLRKVVIAENNPSGIKLGDFLLGDTVTVKAKVGSIIDIAGSYRIEELDIDVDRETITLGVALA